MMACPRGRGQRPLLTDDSQQRPAPIPYRFLERRHAMFGAPTLALMDSQYKLLTNLSGSGDEDLLFAMDGDWAEERDVLNTDPERAQHMREQLATFMASCRRSHCGADYPESYEPVNAFQEVTGSWE